MAKRTTAKKVPAGSKAVGARSVADILSVRQDEVLIDWIENIRTLGGTRTFELMSEEQLRVQAKGLLGR